MRNHIRREAGQTLSATWWLVPLVFAVAAVAAVVVNDAQAPELPAGRLALSPARPDPAVMPAVVVVPAATGTATQPAQAEPVYEVEHVQAF